MRASHSSESHSGDWFSPPTAILIAIAHFTWSIDMNSVWTPVAIVLGGLLLLTVFLSGEQDHQSRYLGPIDTLNVQ